MNDLTMTNDEAHDFLASQTAPKDAGKLGAAIRAIRAKAIADVKPDEVQPPDAPDYAALLRRIVALERRVDRLASHWHYSQGAHQMTNTEEKRSW